MSYAKCDPKSSRLNLCISYFASWWSVMCRLFTANVWIQNFRKDGRVLRFSFGFSIYLPVYFTCPWYFDIFNFIDFVYIFDWPRDWRVIVDGQANIHNNWWRHHNRQKCQRKIPSWYLNLFKSYYITETDSLVKFN